MLIDNVFMELRSRLRSCNVYITTGVDFIKENCNLKISIQSDCIVLNCYIEDFGSKRRDSLSSIESLSDSYDETDEELDVSTYIPISEFCHIIPNSMSCLRIDKNTVSFRILTEPKNGGNFYTELLTTGKPENSVKKQNLKINIKISEELKIVCSNCSNVLSDGCVKFDRILELPSANLDMTEWFCHGHSHGHGHGNEADVVIKQNKLDFLYRLTYFVIDRSILSEKSNKFNSKREVYHCSRCLAWLGLKIKDTVRLYNSEVKVHNNEKEVHIFSYENQPDNVHVNDFIQTIESITEDFKIGFQYAVMCKIVLECTISAAKKQYLLIWIMDKELQVLKNKENVTNNKIELKSSFVTKILYKIELALNEEVENWLTDPVVVNTEISKNMFSEGIEHLQKMASKVPESFRNSNGFHVSYLKI